MIFHKNQQNELLRERNSIGLSNAGSTVDVDYKSCNFSASESTCANSITLSSCCTKLIKNKPLTRHRLHEKVSPCDHPASTTAKDPPRLSMDTDCCRRKISPTTEHRTTNWSQNNDQWI